MGKVARYTSQEITPVATDTFNYVAKHSKEGIRQIAGAIGEGLAGAAGGASQIVVRCHKCNHENDDDAKFCSACGAAMAKTLACSQCGELNDPDARFCDECGQALG
jgi:membrane protease subunit (stomatin/prohibitin family)